ncbi:MAG: hypothetical protein M3S32_06185 [Acidobacteriota bacterium]|nr:hypothetical protein [Acidobacteriota bacterium]
MKRVACLAAALLFLTLPARLSAQAPSEQKTRELEAKIEELQKRLDALSRAASEDTRRALDELRAQIDALTREIETLRTGVPEKAAESTAASHSVPGLGPAASRVYRSEHGVSIGGYGEALYQNFARKRDDGTASDLSDRVDLLRAVFYFGYKFNDRFLFNSEVEYEHASTGEGSEERGEVAVEFAYLDYLFGKSRATGIRAGLVLVPMGFINELHEPPVFLGASRPEVEQRILPSTWSELGVGVFGQAGPFAYRGYVVNGLDAAGFSAGEAIRGGRQEGSNALAESVAVTGRVDYVGLPGVVAGASGYLGGSGQGREIEGRRLRGSVSLFDLHAEWRWRAVQTRALYARGTIGDAARINELSGLAGTDSVPEVFSGAYAEAGYDILFRRGGDAALVPFLRYERLRTQHRVPAGFGSDPANDVRLWTFGLQFKPIPQIVVKADYQDFDDRARSSTDRWNVALGWLF